MIGNKNTWIFHREYQDSHGIFKVEYKDAQGNIHTEPKDPNGNIKSYQNGYIDAVQKEENIQNEQAKQTKRADKNISQGLLLGVIVSCVTGLTAGVIYFLVKLNNPQPAAIINVPAVQTTSVPSPQASVAVVEPPVLQVVPAPKASPSEVKVNITIPPAVSKPSTKTSAQAIAPKAKPKEIFPASNNVQNTAPKTKASDPVVPAVMPMSSPSSRDEMSPTLTRTDSDIKNEILQRLQDNLSNTELIVDVNKGNVMVSGTVVTPEQLQQIKPLLTSIKGINKVDVIATAKMPSN